MTAETENCSSPISMSFDLEEDVTIIFQFKKEGNVSYQTRNQPERELI